MLHLINKVTLKTKDMELITTSKTKAINLAKEVLKNNNGVRRLSNHSIVSTSCQCGCGESVAYTVKAIIGGQFFDLTIGVCKKCNNC